MVRMDTIPLEMQSEESAIRFRDCFSVRYIQSAALLCRLGYQIEKVPREPEPSQEVLLRHEVFILNSVLSAVAFLESTINELFADAADDAYFFADEKTESASQGHPGEVEEREELRPCPDDQQVPEDPCNCRPAPVQ